MKKIIILAVCIVSLFTAACFAPGCLAASNNGAVGDNSQIPNPYITCRTMAKAEKIAGFKMTTKKTITGYSHRTYQAIKKEMLQVSWTKGDDQILIRKAAGKSDISGDYNEYTSKIIVTAGKVKVTMKGDGNTYNVAIWRAGKHSFAIDSDQGLSQETMTALVKATH